MARRFSVFAFAAVVAAAATLVQISNAESYDVGGDMEWTVPQNGAVAYQNWAAGQTFYTGDVLEFEFTTGQHDVAKVTKAAYDACNSTSPIELKTTGPANFTLTAGEHYFICTIGQHCSAGQKLAVNVSTVRAETEFIVGDSLGWAVPTGGAATYENWAKNKTFMVGDSLKFNFTTGAHTVAKVSKAGFDACSGANAMETETEGPADFDLDTVGEHYFICTVGSHCSSGQKLAVNVTARSASTPSTPGTPTSPSPSGSATPSSPSPSGSTTPASPSPSGSSSPSPSGSASPNSSNSAPSATVAGLSATLLSVAAVALLY